MREQDMFQERRQAKPARYTCPFCRENSEFQIHWLIREKKKQIPSGASAEDRQRFAKSRSYMLREDDHLSCPRCRRRFEIPDCHSVVFL